MKNNKGITLIALVVTIIVLLILAGVSIAMLTGQNGILNRASQSSVANAIGEGKDQVAITVADAISDYYDVKYAKGSVANLNNDTVRAENTSTATALVTYISDRVEALASSVPGVTITVDKTTDASKPTIKVTSTEDTNKYASATISTTNGTIGAWSNNY